MSYVVFDLEYNNMQGVTEDLRKFLPGGKEKMRYLYPNEIIQIGAVRLDDDFNETDRLNIFVKNQFYKHLNPFISEMTGITEENLEVGIPFKEAADKLREFSSGSVIITWGISDIFELIRNCHMHSMPTTVIGRSYCDLQELCGSTDFENRTPGLKNAMIKYGLSWEDDSFHDGLYDSICTGEVLREYVRIHGPLRDLKSSRILFTSDSIMITGIKVRDIPDSEITLRCPLCSAHVSYDVSMNSDHGKINSMYHCDSCGSFFTEEITVKENMIGERKYFKKIRKVPKEFFNMVQRQKQGKRFY